MTDMTTQPPKTSLRTGTDPTETTYAALNMAYGFFNSRLFAGALPPCLITLQWKARSAGFFCRGRFETRDGTSVTDEIALNPSTFRHRAITAILSTLVHEMVHLWQHHFGQPSRSHHNREWAEKMKVVGLAPSHTGAPGGRETGPQMTHYVMEGGPFAQACAGLLAAGFGDLYVEPEAAAAARARKAASKTRYTYEGCGFKARAKPDAHLLCGDCGERLAA